MLEHGVEDDQQLAHAGCEGQFLRFASSHQPLVEVPDDGIVATGRQRPHVQDCTDPGASAPNGTPASQCATVPKVRTFGGLSIQTNGRSFAEKRNARSEARWEAALDELVHYGLIEDRGIKGEIFAVTHLGFQVLDNGLPADSSNDLQDGSDDPPDAMGFLHITGKDV